MRTRSPKYGRTSPDVVKIGDRFHRWVVIGLYDRQEDGQARFECRCDCGTVRTVLWRRLRDKNRPSRSCGCLQRERAVEANTTHGYCKDKRRLWVWKTYNMTAEEWDALHDKQLGRCAVCLCTLAESTKVCVDHDHNTGRIRGLLCHGCNVAIGHFKEDPTVMRRAIEYLATEVVED